MPNAASAAAEQPPPFILDLRNRSPPASPEHAASDPARSSSPSSLGESDGAASTNATSEAAPADPLRDQIVSGLIGSPKPIAPGKTEQDARFAYRRTIPTMTLYSERGLSIYEDITKTKVSGRGRTRCRSAFSSPFPVACPARLPLSAATPFLAPEARSFSFTQEDHQCTRC